MKISLFVLSFLFFLGCRDYNVTAFKNLDSNQQLSEPTEPIQANYESIYKNVFISRCVTCHSVGNSAYQVLLSREDLLNSPLELVLPGNPDESGLIIAVERSDHKRMPPEKEGYSALTSVEIEALRKWIADGAQ